MDMVNKEFPFKNKSAVAGIVDRGGGIRVVVTERWRMRFHVAKGERLFVVPELEVVEPVAWGHIPNLIETVTNYVKERAGHGCKL